MDEFYCNCCGQELLEEEVIWDEDGEIWCYECAEENGLLDEDMRRAA